MLAAPSGFQRMDYEDQPTLSLRGGGADQKRKQARKRKFATRIDDRPVASFNLGDMDHQAPREHRPRKKVKTNPDSSLERENTHGEQFRRDDDETKNNENLEPESVNQSGQDPDEEGKALDQPIKPQRFIVFIGNLPYTSTTSSISAHFAKVQPIAIRHRTDKGNGKSKGFAFLEFAAFDRLKTCLKLYHHSMFDDGQSPARKINVELTVGGGGAKSTNRRSKLKEKNRKLAEERRRRAEEVAKVEKQRAKKKEVLDQRGEKESERLDHAEQAAAGEKDIHPSRRGRVSM